MGESQESASRTFKNVKLSVSECKPVTEGKAVWELRNWSDSKDFSLLKKHASCVVEDGDGASLRFFLKEEKYIEKDLIKGYSPTTEVECLSLYVCRAASTTENRNDRTLQDFGFTLRVTVDYLGEAMESSICPPGYRSVPATHLSFEGPRAETELLVLRAFILQSSRITKHSFGEFEPIEEVYSRPNTLRYGITVRFYRCAEAVLSTSNQASTHKQPVVNESTPIFRDFEWMYNQKDNFSDLKLESKDGMIVSAHKFVLAARSPRLRALINEESQRKDFSGRIKIGNVNAKVLLVILNWMYSGKLDDGGIEVNVIEEVIIAAANYELKELLHLLDNKLITVCNSRNMLILFQLAQEYGLHSAVRQISTYISKNIESSVSHPQT